MEWLEKAYACGPNEEHGKTNGVDLIQWMFARHARGEYDQIDHVMREADLSRLAEFYMIALLRSNFIVRGWLAEWKPFLDRSLAELRARNVSEEQIALEFMGLIDADPKTVDVGGDWPTLYPVAEPNA